MEILVLNYTERCNSRCATCNIWTKKDPKTLPLDLIERALSSSKLAGLHNLYLTGGEPYLLDECVEIARIFARTHPGASISGATNALEPKEYALRILAMREAGAPVTPSISINGRPNVHDASRGAPGSYGNCLILATIFRNEGIPYNLAYLDYGQDQADRDHVYELAAEQGVAVVDTRRRYSARYNQAYKPDPAFSFECRAASALCCINPDGLVTACEEDRLDLVIGDLYQEEIDAMDFESVAEFVRSGGCRPCSMGCFEGK